MVKIIKSRLYLKKYEKILLFTLPIIIFVFYQWFHLRVINYYPSDQSPKEQLLYIVTGIMIILFLVIEIISYKKLNAWSFLGSSIIILFMSVILILIDIAGSGLGEMIYDLEYYFAMILGHVLSLINLILCILKSISLFKHKNIN